MCYDVAYMTKKAEKYAKHYGKQADWEDLKKRLPPVYHASGFGHPDLPVIASNNPEIIQTFEWGLIPPWAKDPASATQISNKTINARSEEMFEKPSFRNAAKKNHCLIIVDGFFEHHWKDGKSFPHFIQHKSEEPMTLAGIWEEWNGKHTVSILTTSANPLMARIHNNPKAAHEPRMPVIIDPKNHEEWLKPTDNDEAKEKVKQLLIPNSADEMKAYPVKPLRGKNYIGNKPEIQEQYNYPELTSSQQSLF